MFIDKPFQTDPRHDPEAIVRNHDCSHGGLLEARGFKSLRRLLRWAAILACASSVVACGGEGSTSAAAGGAGSDAVAASFTLYQAALQTGQSYWETLPHTDIASDLAAVAKQLKSSGVATDTYVSDNAVTATLTDGQRFFLVYDDRDITSTLPAAASGLGKATTRSATNRKRIQAADTYPALPSVQHEIAFFVNVNDIYAFDADHQSAFQEAFTKAGFTAPAYEVDAEGVFLDRIVKLGSSHPIDYLNIATHGGGSCNSDKTECRYHWISNTQPDIINWTTYYNDIQSKSVGGGGVLKLKTVRDAESYNFNGGGLYWFTPEFLTAHLQFNPGAVVADASCYGQTPDIAAETAATFAKAGVGLYSGWTGPARGWDSDQSDAYLLDRLLGETVDTGLKAVAFLSVPSLMLINQRTPAQRPFPLTDVIAAMRTVERSANPDTPGGHTLTEATTRDSDSTLVFTTLNGGGTHSNLLIWGLPSIARMSTVERPTGATLFVEGTFPATPGKGQIVDGSGTYPLTPSAWSTTQVQFPLPPGGNGAAGIVTVFSAEGVGSNAVPLTEWKGQLLVTVNDTATSMNDSRGVVVPGVGSGTITTTTDLHFRADVHPVITRIDTVPEPQNFVFSGVMGDSRTSLASAAATFISSDGTKSAHFSLAQPVTIQTPVYAAPVSPGTFIVSPYTGADAPAGCNSGLPGPQTSGPANVFCPFGGINVANALTCSDTDGTLCIAPTYDYAGYYGYPPFLAGSTFVSGYDGLLAFTLDPTTYEITFSSRPATLVEDYLFSTAENLNIDLSATIQPPLHAPTP